MNIENIYTDLLEILEKFRNLKNSKKPLSCCKSKEEVLGSFLEKIFFLVEQKYNKKHSIEYNLNILKNFIMNSNLEEFKKKRLIDNIK